MASRHVRGAGTALVLIGLACAPLPVLSPALPHETNPPNPNGYAGLSPTTQRPFDEFSWRSFVALNWPGDADGKPLDVPIGTAPDAPRVWEAWATPAEVFGGATRAPGAHVLTRTSKSPHLSEFTEAVGGPLIDRNLNFVVYEVRVNEDEARYIRDNGLDTRAGQQAFADAGKTVDFPAGHYADRPTETGGEVGAIELKLAWRILDPEKDAAVRDRYFRDDVVIAIPADESATGEPLEIDAEVGLVGMHVLHKTASEKNWIWSTFEHADNVPRSPEDAEGDGRTYSFWDPATLFGVVPNQKVSSEDGSFLWAAEPPYAAAYAYEAVDGGGKGAYGTQALRVYPVYGETQRVDAEWRAALAGTVWEHYTLIGSQWATGADFPPFPLIPAPARLSNTTMETYVQPDGSCIACHQGAKTTAGQPADFSFLLATGPEAAAGR